MDAAMDAAMDTDARMKASSKTQLESGQPKSLYTFPGADWTMKENESRTGSKYQLPYLDIRSIDPSVRVQGSPLSPVHINTASDRTLPQPSSARIESYFDRPRTPSGDYTQSTNEAPPLQEPSTPSFQNLEMGSGSSNSRVVSSPRVEETSESPRMMTPGMAGDFPRKASQEGQPILDGIKVSEDDQPEPIQQLQYHHFKDESQQSLRQDGADRGRLPGPRESGPLSTMSPPRPSSGSNMLDPKDRFGSPGRSPNSHSRNISQARRTPDARPMSYVDLLNVPYPQPAPAATNFGHNNLRPAVGANASLLSTKRTLEMYRANVKKTSDPAIQYEFAIFLIRAAQDAQADPVIGAEKSPDGAAEAASAIVSPAELMEEARHLLQKLAERSYPFAQYYLADGYASGVFSKGKGDNDRAFPLFVAASKHGHAEAGYRTALCYEFGWGTRRDPLKAAQYYRQSASKNHPGAMSRLSRACLVGDLGLAKQEREGLRWLKRAVEAADFQYNSAPYELGLLHEGGYGDHVFKDEAYAAQLFTQSADLGHAEANFKLGEAYEHGKLNCPQDSALSVHFYNGAATRGHPQAMMALCAWYMVGAAPVLKRDENEAYEWARKAAQSGFPKAQYAVGYFTETGIGCRRDPLEANVWYVRAADKGDERARHRIAAIRAAASGGPPSLPVPAQKGKTGKKNRSPSGRDGGEEKGKGKLWGIF